MFCNLLDCSHVVCLYQKSVRVCNTEFVCKTVRPAFSCQTSAISLPFIPIPCPIPIIAVGLGPLLHPAKLTRPNLTLNVHLGSCPMENCHVLGKSPLGKCNWESTYKHPIHNFYRSFFYDRKLFIFLVLKL